jgi:hypothetical protein
MFSRYFSPRRIAGASLGSLFLLVAACAAPAGAAPGDLVTSLPLTVGGFGVSVASDCDQRIYYTIQYDNFSGDNRLHAMDKLGNHIASVDLRDPAGAPLNMGEMAYDWANDILWGCEHNVNPIRVWKIDRFTGNCVLGFDSITISVGNFRDGITVDINDNAIWISGDVSDDIQKYSPTGTYITEITPTNAGGGVLGLISGIQVGIGDLMYCGRNGAGEIVQVKKSDGSWISGFATPGGRDEGLECDPLSFQPKYVMWSRDFNSPGRIDAVEVEPGTCRCGGVTPNERKTWGAVKAIYR